MSEEEGRGDAAQPAGSQDIAQWWGSLTHGARDWLVEHNGEPLEPAVRAEIMEITRGRTDAGWWRGDSGEGETELTDNAVDWIETVANDED